MPINLTTKSTSSKVCKGDIGGFFPSQMFIPFQLPAEERNWSSFKPERLRACGIKGHALPFSRELEANCKVY